MKKTLVSVMGILFFFSCSAQQLKNKKEIEAFVTSLSKDDPLEKTMNQYILLSDTVPHELKEMVKSQLLTLRYTIEKVGFENLTVKHLQDRSRFLVKGKPLENVYTLSTHKKHLCYLWMANNKIKSLTTMRKGENKEWFITY